MVYKTGDKLQTGNIGPAYWFIFDRGRLLVNTAGTENPDNTDDAVNRRSIPFIEDMGKLRPLLLDVHYLGLIDGKESYFAELGANMDENVRALSGFARMELKMLFGSLEDDWFRLANRAFHLLSWVKKNRFCGVCGGELSMSEDEVAFKCDKCGNIIYPRISPAVIVAITRGEEILLAHSARFANGMYSVIAGFVEAGETLEECVEREIGEEVGIQVRNIRYFCSQPWPYPDSLMVAFTAEYESGEIRIDNKEITDADWYTADRLPGLPLKVSVARKLIDNWLKSVTNNIGKL